MKVIAFLSTVLAAAFLAVSAQAADSQPKIDHTKPAANASHKYKNVDPAAFDQLRKTDKEAVVLDVRTKGEYDKGHIPGAKLLDFTSPDFAQELAKLDKNKTYLVHCASGGRSARACKKMDALDFPKVYNLAGGMTAWQKAGKPVEK